MTRLPESLDDDDEDEPGPGEPREAPPSHPIPLDQIVKRVGHYLPSQGPIRVFIHHNPLHAFEQLPFEQAVVAAGEEFGRAAYLSEEVYREAFALGRIADADLQEVLATVPTTSDGDEGEGLPLAPAELRFRLARYGIPKASGPALQWLLTETSASGVFRTDLPAGVRQALEGASPSSQGSRASATALWAAAREATKRLAASAALAGGQPAHRDETQRGRRDRLLATHGIAIDAWIDPPLIRFTSAYLDQGLAHWALPERGVGMFRCFVATYGSRTARRVGPWGRELFALLGDERDRRAPESLEASLADLGVTTEEREPFLRAAALALSGWAGMVHQFELRPDRAPACAVPARLLDYLAIRLLMERAALRHALETIIAPRRARRATPRKPLSLLLRECLLDRAEGHPHGPALPSCEERAWQLFHLAQLCGLDADALKALDTRGLAALEHAGTDFPPAARQAALHLAYERHLQRGLYDALCSHQPELSGRSVDFQAIFCIDEREESFRRHLEELAPQVAVETFGVAGFFGVAVYYRGSADAHPRPLCPIAIQPQHFIFEHSSSERGLRSRWRQLRRHSLGLVGRNVYVATRTFFRGTVLMATLGVLSAIPLVLRVLFPGLRGTLSRLGRKALPAQASRLEIERSETLPPAGSYSGFRVDEMIGIVGGLLRTIGIEGRFAPLVFVIGHGSVSLNNPQESAHDCGACGGGRGGPNARAFAQMANDPRVRETLALEGLVIPVGTWFIGAERNTANNSLTLFDEDLLPMSLRGALAAAKQHLDHARTNEAHERCRRFEAIAGSASPRQALHHVEIRAADLAQPRPEYGHASNAFCIVGRRQRTRGLYLDRRAFLVSYDPEADSSGEILAHLLAAVVPVVAGISLEYYFGYVDPTGYGCGTKLPHNVTGLIGVMDGAQSDLRTGLPWQMVEIHEAVRLSLVVESQPETMAKLLEQDASLRRLVQNRWLFLACLEPTSHKLWEATAEGFVPYAPGPPAVALSGGSIDYYRGVRDHLPPARLRQEQRQEAS